jgi:hypothetical protein
MTTTRLVYEFERHWREMLNRAAQSLRFHKGISSLSAMKLSAISLTAVTSVGIVAAVFGAPSGTFSPVSGEATERNKKPVLEYVRRVTSSCDIAVELYYVTNCSAARDAVRDEPIPFPFVKVQPVPEGSTGITAIRKIFGNDSIHNRPVPHLCHAIENLLDPHVPDQRWKVR